jgi:hypothetical protein
MPRQVALTLLTATLSIAGYHFLQAVRGGEESDGKPVLPRQYESIWTVHDENRPKPHRLTPGAHPHDPPSDARVLFDGTDLSQWTWGEKGPWEVKGDYLEVNSTGGMNTKESFGDCQLHLEFSSPTPPQEDSQARGNSGIFFMGKFEVQILDSYSNESYADGYLGALYGQHPPMVNASRKPGEWQALDIVFRRPRFEGEELAEPARATVLLNGVLVQHNAKFFGITTSGRLAKYRRLPDALPLHLQDHGDQQPVRFRNVWIRKLDLSPEALDQRP